jgi:hypothetical protein
MFKQNATTILRQGKALLTARNACRRIRATAHLQGHTYSTLRRRTAISPMAFAFLWFGVDPSVRSIERTREALGLSVQQVWNAR